MKKIFVINLGSTSTKVAYFENDKCILKENIKHKSEEISKFVTTDFKLIGEIKNQIEINNEEMGMDK